MSLTRALSYGDQTNQAWLNSGNILATAKALGYEVIWISNQPLLGKWDTPVGFLAKQADQVIGINYSGISAGHYDEDLLPCVDQALSKPEAKKLVILHLMGSHGNFNRRYPPQFARFGEDEVTEFLQHQGYSHRVIENRNAYDNSIRYTDFILAQVLKKLKALKGEKFMLYFSDHGQDVGHFAKNRSGHSATLAGFTIPMVLWPKASVLEKFPAVVHNQNKLVALDRVDLIITSLLGADVVTHKPHNPLLPGYMRSQVTLVNGKVITPQIYEKSLQAFYRRQGVLYNLP